MKFFFNKRKPVRHAMVLGAGFGTRMRHLTQDIPKPMVKLAGKPMIGHVLDRLSTSGIKKAVVNVHYHADVLQEYLLERTYPDIHVSDERAEILNTGGGIARAIKNFPELGKEAFILHNSDAVWYENTAHNNLDRLLAAWEPEKMDCLMMLAPCATSIGYSGQGDFHLQDDGILVRQSGTQSADYVFAGVSIQNPKIFKGCPDGAFSVNTLWDKALANKRMYGLVHTGIWMHVGTPEALEEAEKCLRERQVSNC